MRGVLAVVAVAALEPCVWAQEAAKTFIILASESADISGVVVDEAGKPAPDVEVGVFPCWGQTRTDTGSRGYSCLPSSSLMAWVWKVLLGRRRSRNCRAALWAGLAASLFYTMGGDLSALGFHRRRYRYRDRRQPRIALDTDSDRAPDIDCASPTRIGCGSAAPGSLWFSHGDTGWQRRVEQRGLAFLTIRGSIFF